MTLRKIKSINKEISLLRSKMLRLESEAANTAPNLSGLPGTDSASDKVGNAVTQIADIQNEIYNLELVRDSALNRLSRDVFEENCIYMRLKLHYGWTKIAMKVGRGDTVESIKKACYRYYW